MPITGTNGPDVITGTNGNDDIIGLAGDDTLRGLDGNDTLDGGDGNDILTGGLNADILTGGTGSDIFLDTTAGLNGDRITDFLPGDRIQFTDLSVNNANFNLIGSTLTFTGGSLQIDNIGPGRLVIRPINNGGVEIRLQPAAQNDFDGDGRSDILWRDPNGTIFNFLGTANGGFVNNGNNSAVTLTSDWHVAGTGDFNGDGRVDVLWRNDNGSIFNFLSTASGGYTSNSNSVVNIPTTSKIVGIGDFNGDGRSDILWRNPDGTIYNFLGTANGGFVNNGNNSAVTVANNFKVAGIGDFNGDGLDDIMWRGDDGVIFNFLGTANGGVINNGDNSYVAVATSTTLAGFGDFNGDSRVDLLWRAADGTIFNFLATANGGVVNNGNNSAVTVANVWQVASIGDFNGDAIDDILWRNNNGTIFDFLGNSNGGVVNNGDNSFVAVPMTTHVQDPFI